LELEPNRFVVERIVLDARTGAGTCAMPGLGHCSFLTLTGDDGLFAIRGKSELLWMGCRDTTPLRVCSSEAMLGFGNSGSDAVGGEHWVLVSVSGAGLLLVITDGKNVHLVQYEGPKQALGTTTYANGESLYMLLDSRSQGPYLVQMHYRTSSVVDTLLTLDSTQGWRLLYVDDGWVVLGEDVEGRTYLHIVRRNALTTRGSRLPATSHSGVLRIPE
jgi:hypothetical protein